MMHLTIKTGSPYASEMEKETGTNIQLMEEVLGPVVQSIVILTTSLRHQIVKYMPTEFSNTLLFFVGKM